VVSDDTIGYGAGNFLYTDNSNHVSAICSGLAAIFSGKFQAINGHISEMVRDSAKLTNRKWHTLFSYKMEVIDLEWLSGSLTTHTVDYPTTAGLLVQSRPQPIGGFAPTVDQCQPPFSILSFPSLFSLQNGPLKPVRVQWKCCYVKIYQWLY